MRIILPLLAVLFSLQINAQEQHLLFYAYTNNAQPVFVIPKQIGFQLLSNFSSPDSLLQYFEIENEAGNTQPIPRVLLRNRAIAFQFSKDGTRYQEIEISPYNKLVTDISVSNRTSTSSKFVTSVYGTSSIVTSALRYERGRSLSIKDDIKKVGAVNLLLGHYVQGNLLLSKYEAEVSSSFNINNNQFSLGYGLLPRIQVGDKNKFKDNIAFPIDLFSINYTSNRNDDLSIPVAERSYNVFGFNVSRFDQGIPIRFGFQFGL